MNKNQPTGFPQTKKRSSVTVNRTWSTFFGVLPPLLEPRASPNPPPAEFPLAHRRRGQREEDLRRQILLCRVLGQEREDKAPPTPTNANESICKFEHERLSGYQE